MQLEMRIGMNALVRRHNQTNKNLQNTRFRKTFECSLITIGNEDDSTLLKSIILTEFMKKNIYHIFLSFDF